MAVFDAYSHRERRIIDGVAGDGRRKSKNFDARNTCASLEKSFFEKRMHDDGAQQLFLTRWLRLLTMFRSLKSNFLIEMTASRLARCAQNDNKKTKGIVYEEQ